MSLNTKRLLNALGIAFDENQDEVQARLDLLSTEEKQDLLLAKDFATQTTLAAVLAKLSADPATQTTLAAILAKIIAAPSTEAKQDTIIGHVNGIEGSVDGIETALGTLLTLAGYNAKADITQSTLRDAIRGASDKTLTDLAAALAPLATAAKQDAMATLIGALNAAAVTDPASTTAVLIALVKGLLKQMQGGGSGSMPVQLSGSKMKLYGASLNDRPDATTVPIGATFTIVDASQDFKTWMSNGVNWGEEI